MKTIFCITSTNPKVFLFTMLLVSLFGFTKQSFADNHREKEAKKLLDLSGLVWLDGNRFLAVSDAKSPEEDNLNRVSILTLPESLSGVGFQSLDLLYPNGGKSNDLESAAAIPGTDYVLLCESSHDNEGTDRIFLAKVGQADAKIEDVTTWETFTKSYNIESSAISGSDNDYLFFWAERAQDKTSTEIQWAKLKLKPF